MSTIEQQVDQTINQRPLSVRLAVSGRSPLRFFGLKSISVKIYPPTIEAMCRIGAITSAINYRIPKDEGVIASSVIESQDMIPVARICGVLCGGVGLRGRFMGWLFRHHMGLGALHSVIAAYTSLIDVQGFFGIITSLRGTSILTPTREVIETPPSGQPSEASANTTGGKKVVYANK